MRVGHGCEEKVKFIFFCDPRPTQKLYLTCNAMSKYHMKVTRDESQVDKVKTLYVSSLNISTAAFKLQNGRANCEIMCNFCQLSNPSPLSLP